MPYFSNRRLVLFLFLPIIIKFINLKRFSFILFCLAFDFYAVLCRRARQTPYNPKLSLNLFCSFRKQIATGLWRRDDIASQLIFQLSAGGFGCRLHEVSNRDKSSRFENSFLFAKPNSTGDNLSPFFLLRSFLYSISTGYNL